MTDQVSLWANFTDGEYNDRKLYESENIMVVRYCGQKNARNDKYVGPGNHFFYKINKKQNYRFAGKVLYSKFIEKEKQIHDGIVKHVNIFELVVAREAEIPFRIKKDAYRHFGWRESGQDYMSGIIKHSL